MMTDIKNTPVFVLTMPNETHRQKNSREQLKGIFKNVHFCSSPKPKEIPQTYIKWKRRLYFGRDLTLGEFGCFYAHKRVLEKMIIKNLPYALILEDDFIFLDTFKENIENLIKCSYDWELIRLISKPKLKRKLRKPVAELGLNNQLFRLGSAPGGAYAYLISKKGAEKLLKSMDSIWCPIDVLMGQPWKTNLEILAVMPPITDVNWSFDSAIGEERFKKQQLTGWQKRMLPVTRFYFKSFEGIYRKYYFFKHFFKS
jgi:glycosyl transferase, family 25